MQASIQYCHFLGRAVEEIVASLFNMSRVSCHSVVLSYFVRLGGMQVRPQAALYIELSLCICLLTAQAARPLPAKGEWLRSRSREGCCTGGALLSLRRCQLQAAHGGCS